MERLGALPFFDPGREAKQAPALIRDRAAQTAS